MSSYDPSEVGRRLRADRHTAGLSQLQLAQAAGVSWITVWRYENGEGGMSVATLLALATALGVPVSRWLD